MKSRFMSNPLGVIFFTVLVDLLGFGILIPVIPILLADPRSPHFLLPPGMSLSEGYIMLGILTAIFPFMQFLAAPILGQLSDRYGRKKVLALSLFGTALSYVIFAIGIVTRNIPLLFFSRALDGITGGNIAVAQASIADITTPKNRVKNFGLLGAAFGVGFIIGPFLGGKLSDPTILPWFTAATPFWFAAILSFLNVLSVLFMFPETLKVKKRDLQVDWGKSLHNIIRAATHPSLRVLFLTNFLFQAGFAFFTTFISIYFIDRFGFTQGNIGDYFAYIGIWGIFAQAVVVRKLSHRFREYQILRFSLPMMGLLILSFFLPRHWWELLFITPFLSIANALSFTNSTALVSNSADEHIQGEVLGINASVAALSQTIPPVLSGFLAARTSAQMPLLVAALTIIVGAATFLLLYRPPKQTAIVR